MKESLITSIGSESISEAKMGQIKDLITPILRTDLTERKGQFVIEAGGVFQKSFRKMLERFLSQFQGPFQVRFNSTMDLDELVESCSFGKITSDFVNNKIKYPSILPTSAVEGSVDMYLISIKGKSNLSTEQVNLRLESLGMRSATVGELLFLATDHREIFTDRVIIAPGSISKDGKIAYISDLADNEVRETRSGSLIGLELRFTDTPIYNSSYKSYTFIAAVSK